MKKTLWTFFILIFILFGIYIWQRNKLNATNYVGNDQYSQTGTTSPTTTNASMSTFTSADGSIIFSYPTALSVSQTNNIIILHHEINFQNTDACNMQGAGNMPSAQSPTLTDFNVTIRKFNLTIASSAEAFDPTLSTSSENTDGTLTLNPGTIDAFNVGPFNGYMVTEGVEGCGYVTYYLPVSNSKTLVVQKQLIGALSDIADPINKAKILSTNGAISTDASNQIFNSIIASLQVK